MKKIIILLVCALLLMGCIGNESKGSEESKQGKSEGKPQDSPQQEPPQLPSLDPSSELTNLLNKGQNAQYQVVYDLTSNGYGEPLVYEMTQYKKGAAKTRIDTTTSGISSRSYVLLDKVYTCSDQKGWTCYEFSADYSQSTGVGTAFEDELSTYEVKSLGDRQIVGTSSKCFSIKNKSEDVEYCLSAEGVPLYMKSESDAEGQKITTTMVAKSYNKDVSDGDFELPAKAQKMDLNSINTGNFNTSGSGSGSSNYDFNCEEVLCNGLSGQEKVDCVKTYCNQ